MTTTLWLADSNQMTGAMKQVMILKYNKDDGVFEDTGKFVTRIIKFGK